MKWHLYFIMWVSGWGKWTAREWLKNENNPDIQFLKSYVTREMRPWEENGDKYWFISNEEFEESIEKNEFLEYEINHKVAYYGTKQSDVEDWLEAGKILITEIDTKWLIQVHDKHPQIRSSYSSIFLDAPNEVLRERFYQRHPDGNESDLINRLESTDFERKQAEEYCDYIVDATQSPEEVLAEIKKIIGI